MTENFEIYRVFRSILVHIKIKRMKISLAEMFESLQNKKNTQEIRETRET